MKNICHTFFVAIVVILAVFVNLLFYQNSFAISGFGGRITVAPVICTNGIMITLGPPKPGNYLITPVSKKYLYSIYKSGSWTLGRFTSGGQCLIPPSAPIPVVGTILIIGTSK